MKVIVPVVAAMLVCTGNLASQDKDKKIDPAKLVGKWDLSKSSDPKAPKNATVEFTKDNKVKVIADVDGTKLEFGGTYKVDGDKLTVKLSFGEGKDTEDTDTIQSLTDEKLILVDKEKKQNEFTKKK